MIEQSYIYVQDRLNKLSSNSNQKISKRQFVYAYNKMQLHWFKEKLKNKEFNALYQDSIQKFIETIDTFSSTKEAYVIKLPSTYFQFVRVYGICGECKSLIEGYPREESNAGRLLQDDFHRPSLEWEETFFTIKGDKIYFYKDFKCEEVNLLYYRYPKEVDMNGIDYRDRLGTNIDSELDPLENQEVLDLVVQLLSSDIQDPRYQTITNHIAQNR